jgi:hypothetical protein
MDRKGFGNDPLAGDLRKAQHAIHWRAGITLELPPA